jgi:hypothetical protein
VLKVTQTRAFDTEAAGSSYATGFVVDKARGLILTNRHVVTPGERLLAAAAGSKAAPATSSVCKLPGISESLAAVCRTSWQARLWRRPSFLIERRCRCNRFTTIQVSDMVCAILHVVQLGRDGRHHQQRGINSHLPSLNPLQVLSHSPSVVQCTTLASCTLTSSAFSTCKRPRCRWRQMRRRWAWTSEWSATTRERRYGAGQRFGLRLPA